MAHVLKLSGAMCIYTALEQKQQLLSALQESESLVLDLQGVEEMDSAGYQLLWLVHREAGLLGKVLTLLNCSVAVDDVLHFFDAVDLLACCVVSPESQKGPFGEGVSHD